MRSLLLFFICVFMAGSAFSQESAPFASFDVASEPGLRDPHDLAIGPDGRLYVADKFANQITILDPDTLEILGAVETGSLPNVHDISFGPDGRAAIAVTGLSAVLVFDRYDVASSEPVLALPAARTEGALLDPVYTAKAFALLLERLREWDAGGDVVFVHTGGQPALFAYADEFHP